MLDTIRGFTRGIWTLHPLWRVWVAGLLVVNAVLPFFFLPRIEAVAVLAAILLGAAIQMAIFRARGFVRLLGLGHLIPWTPLLPWLWLRLPEPGVATGLRHFILGVLVLDGISWVIDLVDVARWIAGDRDASVPPP